MNRLKEILFFNPFEDYLRVSTSLSVTIMRGALFVAVLQKIPVGLYLKFSQSVGTTDQYASPSDAVSAVNVILTENNIKRGDMVLSVPDEWVFFRVFELPESVEENLAEVISFEMDRYTPFSPEQVYHDFTLLDRSDGRLKVAVYVINRERIVPYISRFKEGGMNVSMVTFNHASEALFYSLSHPKKTGLFISASGEHDMVISRSAFPLFAETVSDTNGNIMIERVLDVIEKGVEGCRPDEVVVDDGDNDIGERLKNMISIPVIKNSSLSYRGIRVSESVPIASLGSSAMGIYPESGVDLLRAGKREKRKKPVGFTIVLLLVLLLIAILNMGIPFMKVKGELEVITRRLNALKAEGKEIDALKRERDDLEKRLKAIAGFKNSNPVMLEILRELTMIMPPDTWLTRLDIKGAGVEIEGFSDSATNLISILESSSVFKNVSFSSTTVKDRRLDKERFRIKAELESGGTADEKK